MFKTPQFPAPKIKWGNPANPAPRDLRGRNVTRGPHEYEVGGLPGQVLTTGMRLDHTSPEYLETLNIAANQRLRQCINCLESIQVRRTAWLTAECVDVPISYAYECQPKAVRRRINILPTRDSDDLFSDPEVGSGNGNGTGDGGGALVKTSDEVRTDRTFQRKLDAAYRTRSKMWKRIRAREFTIWPIHTTDHFVTILLRMRRSDPNAPPSSPYDEMAQFTILEPVGNLLMVKRIHRRLRHILSRDGIRIGEDAFRGLWYPKQHDGYSCGIRAYRMAKEFMERLSWIHEIYPLIFHLTNKPVQLDIQGHLSLQNPLTHSPVPFGRSPNPMDGPQGPTPSTLEAEADFERLLWGQPFSGNFNGDRVRQEMTAGAAFRAIEFFDWEARVGVVPIRNVADRDLVHNELARRRPGAPGPVPTLKFYSPRELRSVKGEFDIQRFKGQQLFNPVQNPGNERGRSRTQVLLDSLANVTLDNKLKRQGEDLEGETAQKISAKRRKRTKVTKLRKGRHDRYGPAFINVPAFQKVLGGRVPIKG
ncbi:hypothetical protein PG993_003221 [Apiospora rasikravindrae]|uniref:Ubiquitin-like protease family profile domain-containing protein n=1 Tax=Apiospora rasikravindrae TaxID=990691 RepID=A0ABR1TYW3_9PEZI